MTWELAKQLKDAGFPNIFMTDHEFCDYHQTEYFGNICYHIPNLSELTEACGNNIIMWKYNNKYFSSKYKETKGEVLTDTFSFDIPFEEYYVGDTPEEAVANLWLNINKKL